jgi:hypothetical protein
MYIYVSFTNDNLISEYRNDVNFDASIEKFKDMLLTKLTAIYPSAEIVVECGNIHKILVNFDRNHHEVDQITMAMDEVWGGFEWLILNDNKEEV